ncbi:MAG TPA: diacylglycerol kinase family protein [Opitutaceae bacterium]|nr:diacylglycerol kinase family protein [Opitutaceae bacterium]
MYHAHLNIPVVEGCRLRQAGAGYNVARAGRPGATAGLQRATLAPRTFWFSFARGSVSVGSTPLKTRFIVNPRSGRALRALPAVQAFAHERGADVVLTERSRHASELAARALADGCTLIVAVGGDGTMNEVASTLVHADATLGLVPCGSGDGLGRHLRIHGAVSRALEIVARGAPRAIDTGVVDGHPFFTVAGLGFEAEISRRFNALQRRGFVRYLTTSARALRSWEPQDYTIVQGTARERVHAFTLAVANSDQYGNDALIAPNASVEDGLLDLTIVPPVTFWNAVPLIVRLFHGSVGAAAGALRKQGTQFVIERGAPGLIHTDGEVHEAGRVVEFSIRPGSLRVMCPV